MTDQILTTTEVAAELRCSKAQVYRLLNGEVRGVVKCGNGFKKGNVMKLHGSWIGRWWENGERRAQKRGRTAEMTKSQAKEKLLRNPGSCQCRG